MNYDQNSLLNSHYVEGSCDYYYPTSTIHLHQILKLGLPDYSTLLHRKDKQFSF